MKPIGTSPAPPKPTIRTISRAVNFKRKFSGRAYELYEQRGRTDGQNIDDWLQAETEMQTKTVTAYGRRLPHLAAHGHETLALLSHRQRSPLLLSKLFQAPGTRLLCNEFHVSYEPLRQDRTSLSAPAERPFVL
jgi:hypothetical protein